MESFSFIMIVFLIFLLSLGIYSYLKERRTMKRVVKVVSIIILVIEGVIISIFVIRAVFQYSMYKNAVITEATLIQKNLEVKWSSYFIYEYIVDTVQYRGEDYGRRVTSDLEIGDTFYIFYDSTRPWMATYLEKNERLLTDPSWANRQFVLKRKKTMLWWRD
jgi:hypothetical protein